ncbi:1-aminocyclopropane-1-carboxylate synthase CMW33 [Cucumis sativus]|uniref:1-aminocyclopropane-1-carboxylate synthase n=2 Tax=Cucumis sativus TaxID=3659 RepID=O82123_CUCSA|nr:1-aminocyclopropane-1-carboxylate synthase CMW33 [Cucumis sativus]BAA33374.1 ACC synthase [Cucumis sativus]BAA93714.1 1-aminocyclopropane-1-carboxylate synthase [Cucumis sativus]
MGFQQTHETNQVLLSKIAISDGHGEDSPYFDGWKAYDNDPFHPENNPSGVIQMGLAENQLSPDLLVDWIKKHPKASICTDEGLLNFKDIANFQDYHGLPEFRNAIASFMGKARGGRVKFDPSRIVMGGGATGASEAVIFCLADPGDAFLIPSPYYAAFDRDLQWRTRAQIIPVHCNSSNNFQITREALEVAYKKAEESNIKVKGLIITNPSNPLGTIYDRDTLKSLVNFVNDNNIHLVCDEIYCATVFKSPSFISIAEIIEEMDHCKKELIHILSSLSKDMELPGFRVGILYSYNDTVVSIARKMSSFGLVSSQTQHLLAAMLSDDEFVDNFLVENSKRLAKRHARFTKELEKMGITCLNGNAGLFVWMDLRKLLKDQSFESEMELWRVIINEVKLNVSPGSSFRVTEPGWFRVCFANMDDNTVDVALGRIHSFVGKIDKKENNTIPMPPKKKPRENKLRLSFSFSGRRYEEGNVLKSPHMMSPHSPLVRAKT